MKCSCRLPYKFYTLEDDPCIKLDPDIKKNVYALHLVFLPITNQHMEEFRQAWNNHKLRSEGQKTPKTVMAIWFIGQQGKYTASRELVNGDVNLEQSLV